jgi:predicted transcriptional regulator
MDAARKKKKLVMLRTSGKGVGQTLGSLESEIMELIWRESPASVRDIYEQLLSRRQIAYTTVMTVLNRLYDKGMLKREQVGRAYLYTPTQTRAEYCSDTVRTVMKGLISGFGEPALSHFVDSVDEHDTTELDDLIRIIEEKKKTEVE